MIKIKDFIGFSAIGSIPIKRRRLISVVYCCAVILIPFFLVTFPPITDLPQHTAQIRLWIDALTNTGSEYVINWLTPHSLAYLVFGACWMLFGPLAAGKIAVAIIGIFLIVAIHWLSEKNDRSVGATILGSALFFSHVMYFGFVHFVFGGAIFFIWLQVLRAKFDCVLKELAVLMGVSWLIYFSHILWIGPAIGWLLLGDLLFRRRLRPMLRRFLAVLPVLVACAVWYPSLADSGFDSEIKWVASVFDRLSDLEWMANSMTGGIYGFAEWLLFFAVLLWTGISVGQNWRVFRQKADMEFLLLGLGFLGAAIVFPDVFHNTLMFSTRWVPFGTIIILLGLPHIERPSAVMFALLAALVFGIFSVMSAVIWEKYEREEMSGMAEVLQTIPENQRVLGLDFVKKSENIRVPSFLQMFSYAQVLKGGSLNFSFADFGSSPVTFRHKRKILWTDGLEWRANRLDKKRDLAHFDYVIINDTGAIHQSAIDGSELIPVTHGGRWRLYQVDHSSL